MHRASEDEGCRAKEFDPGPAQANRLGDQGLGNGSGMQGTDSTLWDTGQECRTGITCMSDLLIVYFLIST